VIRVACPTCRAQFDVQEAFAGRIAKCPNCNGQIQIPAAASPPVSAAAMPPIPGTTAPTGLAGKSSGVTIAGFVCGIVGLVLSLLVAVPCVGCWLIPVAMPTAVAGLVCSIIGLIMAKKNNQKKVLAVTGLVLSVVAIIWAPLMFFLVLGGLGALAAGGMATPPRF
jgi:hypothetical protein